MQERENLFFVGPFNVLIMTTYLLPRAAIQYDDWIKQTAPKHGVDAEDFLKNCWIGLTYNESDPNGADITGDV